MVQCPLCRTRYADGTSACPLDGAVPAAVPPVGAYGPSWSRVGAADEPRVAARGHTELSDAPGREARDPLRDSLRDPLRDSLRDSLLGQTLEGRLRVLRRIGQGGMGTVYAAEHVGLGKQVAVKVLNAQYASQPDVVPRLHIEARHAAAIQNEHIVDIFDIGTIQAAAGQPDAGSGRPYMVMELLQGESLAQRLARCSALSEADTLSIGRQLAAALDAAHQQGIVHRDIKPENIFLCPPGEREVFAGGDFVKLLDFGISKVLRPLGYTTSAALDGSGPEAGLVTDPRLTRTGAILGTPLYMSPEQVRGEPLDLRVDIYALGVVLYECLTGSVPYSGPSYLAVVAKILTEPPEPPSLRSPERPLSPQLERIVLRAMAPDRNDRYPTMGALLEELERYAAGGAGDRRSWSPAWPALPSGTRAAGGRAGAADRLLLGGVQAELWRPISIGMALVLSCGLLMAVALRRSPPASAPVSARPAPPASPLGGRSEGTVRPSPAPPESPAPPAPTIAASPPEPSAPLAGASKPPPAAAAITAPDEAERPIHKRLRARPEPAGVGASEALLEEQAPNPFMPKRKP